MLKTSFIQALLASDYLERDHNSGVLEEYQRRVSKLDNALSTPLRTLLCAYWSSSPEVVFLHAYQNAVSELVGSSFKECVALCAAEKNGSKPYQIEATIYADPENPESVYLTGRKSFVTCGEYARHLLVWAVDGRVSNDDSGQVRERPTVLLKVSAEYDGVELFPTDKKIPIVPGVPHAQAVFSKVRASVSEILPGDGYRDYVRRFRWLEDLYVTLGFATWLWAQSRKQGWSNAAQSSLLSIVQTLVGLIESKESADMAVVLFDDVMQRFAGLIKETDVQWLSAEQGALLEWKRDRQLFQIGAPARQKRTANVWRNLFG